MAIRIYGTYSSADLDQWRELVSVFGYGVPKSTSNSDASGAVFDLIHGTAAPVPRGEIKARKLKIPKKPSPVGQKWFKKFDRPRRH